jgi:hypothetical protein
MWCVTAVQAPQVAAQTDSGPAWEALRAADLQLASIGFRLSAAAAPLCDQLEPGIGVQFHTLAQYTPATQEQVRAHFRFAGPVAVEGVIAGSPAAIAGVRPDDTLAAINGAPVVVDAREAGSTAPLVALHGQFARLPPGAPVELTLIRAGHEIRTRITPTPICLTRYELRIDDNYDARANGELVQITSKYLESVDAELLPAVIAHELSHNILRHRVRLSAAGADFGFASGFGRNLGLFRQTEIEADILAVHLLARAGYAPDLAARFWRKAGPGLLGGMMRSRSHPSLRDRIAIATAEAARVASDPAPPPFFATRNAPLDGNWRQYLQTARRPDGARARPTTN